MDEPLDIDEMICRSICAFENQDTRKKLANSIILVGGVAKTKSIVEVLED
jgi:actin-related protein